MGWIQRTDIQILLSDDVYFSNLDIGWIAGYLITPFQRALHKTTDSGLSWNVIVEVEDARKFYVFPDPIYWISNGFSKEYITTNGGQTWVDITMGFNNFYAPNNNIGYAVGSLGLILRYDDSAYVPVEFSSFTGFYSFDKVELYWTTESETNNYGFEVWRSSDLNKWERLNFITGSGTTAQRQYYTFVDKYLNNHKLYYKLKQIDFDGSYKFSELITVNIPIKDFNLNQNYPNPANPVTNISFIIPQKSFVNINLYSITGRLVRQLINEEKNKGIYNLEINLSNLSSGVYFYRMITDNGYQSTKKLIILK
ncbi:MAG: T9SS type A sorting domain-containing protein [Ignavibacterium sp.]|nr:T9SS type A sorting domain-containing protein [Ignavibacterium sp.]